MRVHFLGDLHGDFEFYQQWLNQKDASDTTIVLGDVGIGFGAKGDDKYRGAVEGRTDRNLFIRGNHDNPAACNRMTACMGDYGYFKNKIFFVAGAWSIDWERRTPGHNFWRNEELTIVQCNEALKLYEEVKPDFLISHDCPESIKDMIVPPIDGIVPCRTSRLLDEMLRIHKPMFHIFSHYHTEKRFNYLGTEFVCLNIKQTLTMDIDLEGEKNED